MPTYDYQCRSCGHTVEVIHPMLEDGPSVCERCGGELRRVLYPTGIIFKGSGFYKTDSRSASSAAVGGGSPRTTSSAEPSPDPASSGKASPKPAADGGEKPKRKEKPKSAD